ncbi:MAG TPA: protein kinase [Bryobacteraceae bacterium]
MQESASEARPTRPPYVIRFGPFELNSRAGELRKHGVRIRLQEKPFQILHMLVEHPGEAVLRDEIRLRLWPNNTIVEFDHSINAAIKRLRDALGESAEEPRYVETLARRGYRFIGQLEPAGDPALQEDDAAAAANAASEAKPALPAEEPADLIGRTVCHYRVLELLGSGGMGVVYRAEYLRLGRAVALKFLSEELAADPTAVDRFEREARTASALSHPNICSIFGVEVYQDRPFIVMELVEGENLAARLRKGPLPLDKVLTLAVPIADALAAAHAKGVIHRDLKPDNVMVTKSSIKLLDFGIARILEPGKASSEQRELTQAGVVPGTLHFASPEQLEGKPADARSDIFAFGLLLYQMLTGRRAFDGDSPAAVIGAILHAQPALDGIPEPLRRIVSACLAKDPDARWQSARDLKLQLEWAAASDVATDASPRKHVSRRMLLAVGACVLLILSLIGLFFRLRPRPEGPLYHVMISTPRLDVSSGSRIALSRDGRRIAFITVDESGARHLAVRSLDSDVVQTIASATDARNDPFWSPDGRSIGYFTTDSLKTVDLASGQVRTLARTAPTPLGGSWGANNQVLFVALGVPKPLATIHAVSAFGGEPKQVTFPRGNEGHMYPHFLSDGKRFLFSVSTGVSGQMELRLGSMDSSETRSLGTIAGNAVPAGPGVLLFRRAEALFAQRVNSRSLSFVGDPVPLMDRIRYYAINGLGAFSASETGVLVFRRGGNTQTHLRWFDRAGKPLGDIGPPGPYWSFDLSRDETKLAATKDDPVLGIGQIWTGDADRAALTRLTANSDFEPHAAWSPD